MFSQLFASQKKFQPTAIHFMNKLYIEAVPKWYAWYWSIIRLVLYAIVLVLFSKVVKFLRSTLWAIIPNHGWNVVILMDKLQLRGSLVFFVYQLCLLCAWIHHKRNVIPVQLTLLVLPLNHKLSDVDKETGNHWTGRFLNFSRAGNRKLTFKQQNKTFFGNGPNPILLRF